MSIQSEITRITNKRDASFTAVANKGVTVPSGSTIDDLPSLIGAISTASPTYSVTKTLTNVTTTNDDTEVLQGNSFFADLIPNTGYQITSITVMMGGVDITNQVFTPGTGPKTITQNGTYNASDDYLSGYSSVTVNVSGGSGGVISVVDTLDSHGGTIREITAIDISNDTVTADKLLQGYTAHNASGQVITGTYNPAEAITVVDTLDSHGGTIREITAVDISNDTVTADKLLQGYTAHNASGQAITGTYTPSAGTLQTKTVSPTESVQTVTPDSGYDGLSSVEVGAISSTYVGSGIDRNDSTDLTASGATVAVPAGYYAAGASKSVASGSATAPASISGTSATVSTGTNTLTLTKTVSVTPTVSAGYVSSGTARNSSVSLTASVTTKAAATITPGTTNQTIAAGTYLTGAQTISGDADLVGSNILSTANIFGVQGTVVIQHYYTGSSAPSASTGVNGDIYLQTGA